MLLSFLVSWRNVTRHKKRFLFTILAVVLGVTVMTGMMIVKGTTASTMENQEQLYAGSADFWIQGNEYFFPMSEIESFSERDEVEKGVASLLKQGFVETGNETFDQASVRLTGVSSFNNGLIELPVKEGDVTKEGLIITENAANLWEKGVGDSLSFTNMGSMEITAIVYEGAMLNSPKAIDEASTRHARVMVPLDILQSWTGMEGQITNYRFETKAGIDQNALLENYQAELSDSSLFIQPVVIDGRQSNDVDGLYYTFDLIAIISVFISAFIAFNMIYASIVERKKEFAVMKSIGYTNRNIHRLVLREIAILSVIGIVAGLPLGIFLGAFIQDIIISAVATQNVAYDLELAQPLVLSAAVGIVFPFLAAAFPVYQAGKVPIMEAMAEKHATNQVRKTISTLRIIAGIICTGIGLIDHLWAFLLLFVGLVLLYPLWMRIIKIIISPFIKVVFHYPGILAIRSTKPFMNRNANTSAMLAIGVSLALFMSALLESLPEGMENDIRSTFGGDIHAVKETPWTEADLEVVEAIDEVENVSRFANVPTITWKTEDDEYREFSMMSFTGDPEDAEMFRITEETAEVNERPHLYLGERALTEWGGNVGDILTLNTPSGQVDFFVKGKVQTSHYTGYVAFVDDSVREKVFNWPEQFHLSIYANDEERNIPIVYDHLSESFGEVLSSVNSVTSDVEQAKSAISGMNELIQGLLILIVALSAIGVSNTLFMNTIERVKEIGTMRAIGFTKSQVRLMIVAEGLLIGVAGVIVGTLYGILVIYLNSKSEQVEALLSFTVPWISLFLAIASGILFSIVASWLPSVTASRVPVKDAINYD